MPGLLTHEFWLIMTVDLYLQVSEQLEHAQRLLEEHKSAKKLKGLVSCSATCAKQSTLCLLIAW